MKKLLFLFILAFAVGMGAMPAFGQDSSKTFSGRIRWGDFEYKWTNADFTNTPSWNPELGDPPVSLLRAVAIAKANLSRFVDAPQSMKVRTIELQAMSDDKWVWRVSFLCSGLPCRSAKTRSFLAIVKLDESILEPKRLVAID